MLPLAKRLRDAGVNAWLDMWELGVGDSLITKIYDEGIGQADWVVVVISANSVGSKWVKDEMEVAKAQEIQDNTRLLPIVLDGSSVPVALSSKRHLRIEDPRNYDEQFRELVQVIFNVERAPALGTPPAWSSFELPGLRPTDAVVLAAVCTWALTHGQLALSGSGPIYSHAAEYGVDERSVLESMTALEHEGLIERFEETDGRVDFVVLTWRALREYIGVTDPDAEDKRRRVLARLVNRSSSETSVDLWALADEIGVPPAVAEAFLQQFADQGLLRIEGALGGTPTIFSISRTLGRHLD